MSFQMLTVLFNCSFLYTCRIPYIVTSEKIQFLSLADRGSALGTCAIPSWSNYFNFYAVFDKNLAK